MREEYAKQFGLSIDDMVSMKQDEEFTFLLDRLDDLSEKLDQAATNKKHSMTFLCDTMARVGQELAAKMREQAQVLVTLTLKLTMQVLKWPDLTLDRFDLADDVEDIVDIYTRAAKTFYKNSNVAKYNAAYDQFTVLIQDLVDDKNEEIRRRAAESESNDSISPTKKKMSAQHIEREKRPVRNEDSTVVTFTPKRNPGAWATTSSPPTTPTRLNPSKPAMLLSSSPAKISLSTKKEAHYSSEKAADVEATTVVFEVPSAEVYPAEPPSKASVASADPIDKPKPPRAPKQVPPVVLKVVTSSEQPLVPLAAEPKLPCPEPSPPPVIETAPDPVLPKAGTPKSVEAIQPVFVKTSLPRSAGHFGASKSVDDIMLSSPAASKSPMFVDTAIFVRSQSETLCTRSNSDELKTRKRTTETVVAPQATPLSVSSQKGNQLPARRRTNRDVSPRETRSDGSEVIRLPRNSERQPEEQDRQRMRFFTVDSNSRAKALQAAARVSELQASSDPNKTTHNTSHEHQHTKQKTLPARGRRGNHEARKKPDHPFFSKTEPILQQAIKGGFPPTLDHQNLWAEDSQDFQKLMKQKSNLQAISADLDVATNLNLLEKQLDVLNRAKENLDCRVQRQSQQLDHVGSLLQRARLQLVALGNGS
jgi:hypothetical protein